MKRNGVNLNAAANTIIYTKNIGIKEAVLRKLFSKILKNLRLDEKI